MAMSAVVVSSDCFCCAAWFAAIQASLPPSISEQSWSPQTSLFAPSASVIGDAPIPAMRTGVMARTTMIVKRLPITLSRAAQLKNIYPNPVDGNVPPTGGSRTAGWGSRGRCRPLGVIR